MKTLILTAGLPGTGKSYVAQTLKKLLQKARFNTYYFDSDYFAKTQSMKGVNYASLSHEAIKKKRIKSQQEKIGVIIKLFKNYNIIILDTCFDISEARNMYYNLENNGINIIILEIKCSKSKAIKRIKNAKDYGKRMPDRMEERLKEYIRMRGSWKEIKYKHHMIISSETSIQPKLEAFVLQMQKNDMANGAT